MRPQVAHERIRVFREQFGLAHLLFAQHAAFPLALTPDLLYRMWANFQRTVQGEKHSIPWIAVADVLLSPLCEEVSHELYEMDVVLRAELLAGLKTSPAFGRQRLAELSSFLLDAIGQQLRSSNVNVRRLAQAQRWTALAYIQPGRLAQELGEALEALEHDDRIEQIRVISLIETLHMLVEPLATDEAFLPLLIYARGKKRQAHGDSGQQNGPWRQRSQALSPTPGNEVPSTVSAQQIARHTQEDHPSLPERKTSGATAEQLFQRAHLLVSEGQLEHALAVLDGIQVESLEQKRDIAYLRAWCAVLQGHWDEVAQYILPREISGEMIADVRELGRTERRRRPYYLLMMGDVAANLWRHEEAIQHYTRCLKFLDERRMNDTNQRIRALLGLGVAHMATGYLPNAVQYYEQALRLRNNDIRQRHVPDLYYGLSDAYCRLGAFERALEYGNMALQVYTERNEKELICRIHSLLGHIYCKMEDLPTSNAYYTRALALAMSTESVGAIFHSFTALADLRLQEGKPEEAWRYCEMALEYSEKVPRPYFVGKMDLVCGQVMEARAQDAGGSRRQEYLEQAVKYYQRAVAQFRQTDARPDLAEVYSRLAHLLEESGQPDQALAYWKLAYQVRAGLEDVLLE
jgi:tetratricopeptide (TPR) repeat protein